MPSGLCGGATMESICSLGHSFTSDKYDRGRIHLSVALIILFYRGLKGFRERTRLSIGFVRDGVLCGIETNVFLWYEDTYKELICP